jgi:hypothetical protein
MNVYISSVRDYWEGFSCDVYGEINIMGMVRFGDTGAGIAGSWELANKFNGSA